jgi:hypothetical protein
MLRRLRGVFPLLAALAGLAFGTYQPARSQAPALGPPVPAPAPPPGQWVPAQDEFPRLTYEPEPPPPAPPPVAPPGPIVPDVPFADPGAEGWGPYGPPSGVPALFWGVDLAFLAPAVKDRVAATVTFDHGPTRTFALPFTELGWTISPRFEVGYRLPDALGFFAFNYRFLSADGSEMLSNRSGDFLLQSRLDLNVFDFDYGVAPIRFAPRWVLLPRVGLRMADVFFDSRLTGDGLSQQIGNNYFGAGPHVRAEVQRHLFIPGLALFGQIDGAFLVGQIRQHFREQAQIRGASFDTDYLFRQTQSVPVLGLQAGMLYTPDAWQRVHFRFGYQFERYFEVGRIMDSFPGATDTSNGQVTAQGLFLNCRVDY